MNARSFLLCAALLPSLAACKDTGDASDDEPTAASQGTDSVQVTDDEASVLSLSVDGSDAQKPVAEAVPATGDAAAAGAMARVSASLSPPGCETATQAGSIVTYVFNECTGPRGLVHLTGKLVVSYTVDTAGVHAHATATDFHVNESTVSIDATAVYKESAGTKTVTVATSGSGTGPLGHELSHQGNYTLTWTGTCHTLDGTWSTTANGLSRSTTVSNLSRCQGFCPAAGGVVSHTYRNGATITLTYQGATVMWAVNGKSGTIQLVCTPAP